MREMLHNYRYRTDPEYRKSVDQLNWLQAQDKPLEDTSFDMVPFAASGLSKVLKGADAGIDMLRTGEGLSAVKAPVDVGRRKAMQTIGATTGAAAVASMPAYQVVKKIAEQGMRKGSKKGIDLVKLGEDAEHLKNIRGAYYRGDKLPDAQLAAINEKADASASKLNELLDGDSLGSIHNTADRIAQSRIKAEIAEQAGKRVPNVRDIPGYIKELGSDAEKEFNNIVEYHKGMRSIDYKIEQMKRLREKALSTKSPTVGIDSLKHELDRTAKRIEATNKAPDKQLNVEYEYDNFDRPTGRSATVERSNTYKKDKLDYLKQRHENLMAQLDSLANKGAYSDMSLPGVHELPRIKGLNVRKSKAPMYEGENQMYATRIDNGPF